MKKTLLMLMLALCTVGAGFAQEKRVKVTGHVTDFETAEPVGMATIQLLTLPDSTFLKGATTDRQIPPDHGQHGPLRQQFRGNAGSKLSEILLCAHIRPLHLRPHPHRDRLW